MKMFFGIINHYAKKKRYVYHCDFFCCFWEHLEGWSQKFVDKIIKITFIYISLVILSLRGILKCF